MPSNNHQHNFNLRSEEVQEILSKPPAWIIRWGVTVIFLFVCLLLSLTFLIRYPDFVAATVIITTERPTERVVIKQSGVLDQIFVKNGDTVVPGQHLGVVRNTAITDDVNFLKKVLLNADLKVENLGFPIDSTSKLVLGDIEVAYEEFEKSYVNYLLLKNLKPYAGELLNNQESISELEKRLIAQIHQKEIQEQESQLIKSDFERYKKLFEKGVISLQEFEMKKIIFLQMQKNMSMTAISISQIREAISTAKHSLRKTDINKQEDHKRVMIELSQSLNNLKKAVRDWEYNYMLSSSTEGILSFQKFWGSNQFITSGEVVFTILPLTDQKNWIGKLIVPSQNTGKIVQGQKVLVKLNNFPYQQHGMLIGRIQNISISPDDEGNYVVYISLPEGTKTSYDVILPMKQELIGTAEIITEELSIAERIFYRIKDIVSYT